MHPLITFDESFIDARASKRKISAIVEVENRQIPPKTGVSLYFTRRFALPRFQAKIKGKRRERTRPSEKRIWKAKPARTFPEVTRA